MINNYEEKEAFYINMINERLYEYIKLTGEKYDIVKDAMLYSLFAGGKRIRPILTLEFCRTSGGAIEKALPFACAIEMIHSYSLIHDDLPCMDDDEMRRGKPSCHKKFGEAIALLAGDGLLTLAFEIIADAPNSAHVDPILCLKAVQALATYAGVNGMIGGQAVDLLCEGRSVDSSTLNLTHRLKTSALICAAVELGVIAANGRVESIANARGYGNELGLAFQIVDDVLDVVGDEKTLGKPVGSDESNQKTTFVTLFSLLGARELANMHTKSALNFLSRTNDNGYLIEFTNRLLKRAN